MSREMSKRKHVACCPAVLCSAVSSIRTYCRVHFVCCSVQGWSQAVLLCLRYVNTAVATIATGFVLSLCDVRRRSGSKTIKRRKRKERNTSNNSSPGMVSEKKKILVGNYKLRLEYCRGWPPKAPKKKGLATRLTRVTAFHACVLSYRVVGWGGTHHARIKNRARDSGLRKGPILSKNMKTACNSMFVLKLN